MDRIKLFTGALLLCSVYSCSDSSGDVPGQGTGSGSTGKLPEWYYAGGELGTSYLFTMNALEQPSPAIENAGLIEEFKSGEQLFEKPFSVW